MHKIRLLTKKSILALLICGITGCSLFAADLVSAESSRTTLSEMIPDSDSELSELSGKFKSRIRDLIESLPQNQPDEADEAVSAVPEVTVSPQPTNAPEATVTPEPTNAPEAVASLTPTPVSVEIPQELQDFANNYPETAGFVKEFPEKSQLQPEIDLSEDAESKDVPLFIQWDERWGYQSFGSSFIGCSGCGPTSFSMAAVYLTHNPEYSPLYMANYIDEHGYHVEGVGTSWNFFTQGCEAFGIHCTTLSVNETKIKEYLDKGFPIICSVGPGDFTVKGHLIVIKGYDENGLKINDPNSKKNSAKSWDFSSIRSQIRSVWAFSAV